MDRVSWRTWYHTQANLFLPTRAGVIDVFLTCAVMWGLTLRVLCVWFNALTLKCLIIWSLSLCFVSDFQRRTEWQTWTLSTVPSLTASLPPWDGSGPPTFPAPAVLALLSFPLATLALLQTFSDTQGLKEFNYLHPFWKRNWEIYSSKTKVKQDRGK